MSETEHIEHVSYLTMRAQHPGDGALQLLRRLVKQGWKIDVHANPLDDAQEDVSPEIAADVAAEDAGLISLRRRARTPEEQRALALEAVQANERQAAREAAAQNLVNCYPTYFGYGASWRKGT